MTQVNCSHQVPVSPRRAQGVGVFGKLAVTLVHCARYDTCGWNPTAEDGVGDNGDAFPNYKGETADSDGNGIGDNAQSSIAKAEEVNELKAQLTQRTEEINTLIAQLDQSLTLDQIQDLRIGSAILTTDIERNRATLKIRIEESSDLKTWTTKNTITKYYTIPEGKKFYRFALDK